MVKELLVVLGIDHQELPEHPSDHTKRLSVYHTKDCFRKKQKMSPAGCTYPGLLIESNILEVIAVYIF